MIEYPCIAYRKHEWDAELDIQDVINDRPNKRRIIVVEQGIVWQVWETKALWSHIKCTVGNPDLIFAEPDVLKIVDTESISFSIIHNKINPPEHEN